MRSIFYFFAVLALVSCAKPNPGEGTVKEVNSEALKTATNTLCALGETLLERPAAEKIYDLPSAVKAFGFLKGTKSCALTSDFHQDSIADSWFRVVLQDDCLQNGSIWTVESITHPDHSTLIELVQVGREPVHHLRIQAGNAVTTQSVFSASGMTLYQCSKL